MGCSMGAAGLLIFSSNIAKVITPPSFSEQQGRLFPNSTNLNHIELPGTEFDLLGMGVRHSGSRVRASKPARPCLQPMSALVVASVGLHQS